jgi:hypothetical protein
MADKKRNIDREDMPNKNRQQDDEHLRREDDTSKRDKEREGNWEEEQNR